MKYKNKLYDSIIYININFAIFCGVIFRTWVKHSITGLAILFSLILFLYFIFMIVALFLCERICRMP